MVHREHLNSYETHPLDNADDCSWAVLGVFDFHKKLLSHGMESGLGENSDHLSVEVCNFLHVVDIGVGEVGTAVCVCVCVCVCVYVLHRSVNLSQSTNNKQSHTNNTMRVIYECNNNTQFSFKLRTFTLNIKHYLSNTKTSPINYTTRQNRKHSFLCTVPHNYNNCFVLTVVSMDSLTFP